MLKKLFSHSLIYAVGPQLPKIVSLFLLPLYTKNLNSIDYGIIGVLGTFTALLSGVRDLGMSQPMANVFFKYPRKWKKIWSSFYGLLTLWSLPIFLIQTTIIWFSMHNLVGAYNILRIILLHTISLLFFELPIKFGSYYFQLSAKPLPIAFISAISGIVTITAQYIFVVKLGLGYMAFIYSYFIASIIPFLYFSYYTAFVLKLFPLFKIKRSLLKYHLKVALPTIPHNYSSYLLNTSDRLVMTFLGIPPASIGLYSFAYNFGNYADMVGSSVGMAISPFSLRGYALNKEYLTRNLFFLMQLLFLTGTAVLCIWIKEVFSILVKNDALFFTYSMAIIIILSYVFRPLYWCVINLLGFKEKTSALWKITLIGGVLNIILNLIFIPIFGVVAACYTTFIALLYIGFAGFFLNEFKQVSTVKYYAKEWLICILFVAICTYFLRDTQTKFKIFYSLLLILTSTLILFKHKDKIKELQTLAT